jgi:predicted RNase H-like nuclease (RuvC/YqgF family)
MTPPTNAEVLYNCLSSADLDVLDRFGQQQVLTVCRAFDDLMRTAFKEAEANFMHGQAAGRRKADLENLLGNMMGGKMQASWDELQCSRQNAVVHATEQQAWINERRELEAKLEYKCKENEELGKAVRELGEKLKKKCRENEELGEKVDERELVMANAAKCLAEQQQRLAEEIERSNESREMLRKIVGSMGKSD